MRFEPNRVVVESESGVNKLLLGSESSLNQVRIFAGLLTMLHCWLDAVL